MAASSHHDQACEDFIQLRNLMKRTLFAVLAVITILFSAGCSTTLVDAESARGTGTVRIYDKPYDVVWDAVVAAIKSTSLAVVSVNKSDGTILAQGAISAFSWGENVAVYVEQAGGITRTRVEIINKRALAANLTASDWEDRLAAAIDQRLGAHQDGNQKVSADVDHLPIANEKVTEAYRTWLTKKLPRAFVITDDGHYSEAWGGSNPAKRAMDSCSARGHVHCRIYAVDNAVVISN